MEKKQIIIISSSIALVAVIVATTLFWLYQTHWRTPETSTEIITRAARNFKNAESAHVEFWQEMESLSGGSAKGTLKTTCQSDILFPAEGKINCVNYIGDEKTAENQVIYLRGKVYIPAEDLEIGGGEGEWLEANTDNAQTIGSYYSQHLIEYFSRRGGERKSFSEEDFDGRAVYKYVFTSTVNKMRGVNTMFDSFADEVETGQVTVEIFVGKDDYLPYAYTILIDADAARVTTRIKFSNYNSDISVDRPAAVIELPSESSDTGTGKEIEDYRARNAKRKTDLLQIAYLLERHYEKIGYYPETPVGEVSRSDDTEGVIYESLVPDFVDSLPLDPLPNDYYYAYSSPGGEDYTLTCVVEDENGDTETFELKNP